jgi:hypothetical protein
VTDPVLPRPAPGEFAPYYGRYIEPVPGDDAMPHLRRQLEASLSVLARLDDAAALHRYAPAKWSVKQVVGHVADAERVFAYRALRFARADRTPLPGFDENAWVPAGGFDARSWSGLLDEWRAVRAATIALFASFDAAALARVGNASTFDMSVRAIGWVIVGHERHHLNILRERYRVG